MRCGTGQYTVGELARLANVSVRTLHHYDRVKLLQPARRSPAGYRVYVRADLERLQQILFYRELGFSLERIRSLVLEPQLNRRAALEEQRRLLDEKMTRLVRMRDLLDRALDETEGNQAMSDEEMFEVFGDFDPREHETEASRRWGGTEAYAESRRRTKSYTAEDWRRFKAESEEINAGLARLIDAAAAPESAEALQAVERMRLQIDRWFYPCSREMHAALGRMYVEDARFTATYDRIRPGLAEFIRDATQANARRAGDADL